MAQEWMALLGAMGFIATIGAGSYIMGHLVDASEKRKSRQNEQRASATPPPAHH